MGTLIDEVLLELESGRASMQSQIRAISEVMENSNQFLLNVENSSISTDTDTNFKLFSYQKKSKQALVNIIHQYNHRPSPQTNGADQSFIDANKERKECLETSVRKLLAITNQVAEITNGLADEKK